jgi:rhamnogalacturonyl hydrolase YesR
LGEVRPQGWLKKQAQLALQGLTYQPHLLESNVWRVAGKTADQDGPTMAWWPYEQQAYYIDGATRLAHVLGDQRLLDGLQPTFEAVIARQDETGYYFCDDDRWRQSWRAGDEGTDHERWMETGFEGMHWSKGIFARAVLAHYQATGDPRLLELLRKHFLNY